MTKDFTVLLRAVAHSVSGADILYTAASLLTPGKNAAEQTHNMSVLVMAARLLRLPETNPEVMEYVLRNLPEREMKERKR